MNYQIKTLNNISKKGLKQLTEQYVVDQEGADSPDAILVRSAKMHDMAFNDNLSFIGRAGAGVNNIPLDRCAEQGIVVCNAPGANANAVKELVATAMLISSRKVVQGIEWTKHGNDAGTRYVVESAVENEYGYDDYVLRLELQDDYVERITMQLSQSGQQ